MGELRDLTFAVRKFALDRDWEQFHTPKDLAIGVATEAAELLQLHRFKEPLYTTADAWDEVGDVLIFLLRYCDVTGINPVAAVKRKLEINAEKYPVEIARGSNEKYSERVTQGYSTPP